MRADGTSRVIPVVWPASPPAFVDGDLARGHGVSTTVDEAASTFGVLLPRGPCAPANGELVVLDPRDHVRVEPQWSSLTMHAPDALQVPGDDQHCDFGSITYLKIGSQWFTRDPTRLFGDEWFRRADGSVRERTLTVPAPPPEAQQSDLVRSDGAQLWRTEDAAFVVHDGLTEQ